MLLPIHLHLLALRRPDFLRKLYSNANGAVYESGSDLSDNITSNEVSKYSKWRLRVEELKLGGEMWSDEKI